MLTAIELTLLLLAASIVSVLALRRLGMPPLVAYLLVGVLFGRTPAVSPRARRCTRSPSSAWCS
jgi:Kef-type K+ transport system membrane component KefB